MKRVPLLMMLIVILLPYVLTACSIGTTTETTATQTEAEATTVTEGESLTAVATEVDESTVTRPEGWAEESHSNDADLNYEVVFPEDKVNQITITVSPENYAAMQADMTELFGDAGEGNGRPGGGGFGGGLPDDNGGQLPEGFEPPAEGELRPGGGQFGGGQPGDNGGQPPEGFEPPAAGELPPGGGQFGGGGPGGGFGGGNFSTENPMWVTATIEFNDQTWTNVGVRYKGNSSLRSTWSSDSEKLPFKLDFDEFEDDYPEITNQRFYGFQQLSLANGFGDATYMRDAVTYDLLEEAGLASAETAYYEVFLDTGEGPVSLGLYTAIEVIDDTVIDREFDGDNGNIYEADGTAASLAEGTYEQIETSFQKENNEDEADWSDIEELYTVLHSDERTSDPEAWRAKLDTIFDTDVFLKWLALSAVLQHWDTYGGMTHNYYLYDDPDTGKLTWVSWDHNLVLGGSVGGSGNEGGNGGGGGRGQNATLDKANVTKDWPLIRYLMDDPVYNAKYVTYMEELVNDGIFEADTLAAKYQQLAELIKPYATIGQTEEAFNSAVVALTERTYAQAAAAATFLAGK
jgi:spore coat protein H